MNPNSPNPRCACGECGTFVACFTGPDSGSGADSGAASPGGAGESSAEAASDAASAPPYVGAGTLPFDGEARKLHLNVLRDITTERERQDAKWGQQNHESGNEPSGYDVDVDGGYLSWFRSDVERAAQLGRLTWQHIAHEEVLEAYEAIDTGDDVKLREELVQCAAVFTAWIECLDRKANLK